LGTVIVWLPLDPPLLLGGGGVWGVNIVGCAGGGGSELLPLGNGVGGGGVGGVYAWFICVLPCASTKYLTVDALAITFSPFC
jgi:hypothetical protein